MARAWRDEDRLNSSFAKSSKGRHATRGRARRVTLSDARLRRASPGLSPGS